MKRTNKGFTLVELIIVIAVIGVLAAILIPVFSNVIKKANLKSAFADARNAVSNFVADNTTGENGGAVFGDDGEAQVNVQKAGKTFYFEYKNNGLQDVDYDTAIAAASNDYTTDVSGSVDMSGVPANVVIIP